MNIFARAWNSASADDQRETENAQDLVIHDAAIEAGDYAQAGQCMRRIQARNQAAGIVPRSDFARQLCEALARDLAR